MRIVLGKRLLQDLPRLLTAPRAWRLAALVANGFAQAVAMVAIALVMRRLIDDLNHTDVPLALGFHASVMVLATLVIGWLKRRERIDAETIGQDYVADIRMMVFQHVSQLSARALGETRKGLVLLRFVNDLTALRQWVALGIARLTVSGVVLSGAMLALTLINPILGGLLCLLIGIGVLSALMLGRSLDVAIRESRRRRANIAANLTEKLERMVLVQAFAQRDNERKKVKRQTNSLKRAMIARAGAVGTFRASVHVIVGLAMTITIVVGAALVRSGAATTGQIMASLGIVSLVTPNFFDFGRVFEYRKSALIAYEKTASLLSKGPKIESAVTPQKLRKVQGHLKFENITVSGSLRNFSAEASAGSRVAITGPNGAGKSTLLLLALRLVEPSAGRVLVDGLDVRTVRTGHLRRSVSIASPILPLLRGSVASNIAYGSKTATQNDIEIAAAVCGMDALNPKSPYWLESPVDEGGANLSMGQRMRIVLARAVVGLPPILLLDEPDSHLDKDGLEVLKNLIHGYAGTVIFATHRNDLEKLATHQWRLNQEGTCVPEMAA